MRLDPKRVQDVRALVLLVIRLVALWLIAWGVFQITARLAFGVLGANSTIQSAWGVWMGIGAEHGIFRGIAALAVGAPLATLSRSLSRWIVRSPETTCPRCAHEGPGGAEGICTECGLTGFTAD